MKRLVGDGSSSLALARWWWWAVAAAMTTRGMAALRAAVRKRQSHPGERSDVRDGHPQRRGLVLVGRQEGRRAGGQGRGRQAHLEPVQQRPAEAGAADRRRGLPEGRRPGRLGPNPDAIKGSLAKANAPASRSSRSTPAPASPRRSARSRTSARPRRSPARRPASSSRPRAPRRCSASSTSRTTSASQQRCDGVKQGFGGDVTTCRSRARRHRRPPRRRSSPSSRRTSPSTRVITLNPDIAASPPRRDQGRELGGEAGHVRPRPGRDQAHQGGRGRCSRSTSSSTCRATCRSCS